MENNKNKTIKKIAPNFGKDPKRAIKILQDEKKARDLFRKKYDSKVA